MGMKASVGSSRPRVLFLSQRFLFPMDTGGKIRTGNMLRALREVFYITLISNVEQTKDGVYLDHVSEICDEFRPIYWQESIKYSLGFYIKVFLRSFSRYPVTVINDYSKALESAVLAEIDEHAYDLLICDFLQPSLNFRKVHNHKTLLFQHNVESMILQRHYETASNSALRFFWRGQWEKMRRYEKETCQQFDAIAAVSEVDKEVLETEFKAKNVFAIPTGVDTRFFSPRSTEIDNSSLVFVGSMDWLPNEDSIIFLQPRFSLALTKNCRRFT